MKADWRISNKKMKENRKMNKDRVKQTQKISKVKTKNNIKWTKNNQKLIWGNLKLKWNSLSNRVRQNLKAKTKKRWNNRNKMQDNLNWVLNNLNRINKNRILWSRSIIDNRNNVRQRNQSRLMRVIMSLVRRRLIVVEVSINDKSIDHS